MQEKEQNGYGKKLTEEKWITALQEIFRHNDRYILWSGKSACAILRTVQCLLYYGRGIRAWCNDRKCRIRKMSLSWLPVILLQQKKFRFPLAYGNQRPKSATWTVTGCGAAVVGKHGEKNRPDRRDHHRPGSRCRIRDSMNMGAAMAPAAFHTVMQNLKDLEITKEQLEGGWYDKIITGDLGKIGKQALADLIRNEGLEAEGFFNGLWYGNLTAAVRIPTQEEAAVAAAP